MSMDDKAFKICNVLGGLDVTRVVSSNTRHVFQQAIEDVELIREFVSQSASLESSKLVRQSGMIATIRTSLINSLPGTFQWKKRGYSQKTTSLEAGLGYTDDTPKRVIDRFVSMLNQPFVGDKESDLRIINSVSALFPWLVDRKSIERDWWVPHLNGRSEGQEKEEFLFDSLYAAAWIGTYGDAWAYYPPFWVFGNGHPLVLSELTGPDLDSHDFPFVEPNFPKNNPTRRAYLRDPYPDIARQGMSLITAMAPVYFTGTYNGFEYEDTYIASTGLDIAVESVSTSLDVLLDTLTDSSFAILVDTNLHTIVISQTVVDRIYPIRTGFEEERVNYDLVTGEIVADRRNQTYMVSDTIHQDLTQLNSANWAGLLKQVRQLRRGDRDFSTLNITLTGEERETEYYAMFERWNVVADWILVTFAPKYNVEHAIDVLLVTNEADQSVFIEGVKGTKLVAEAAIINRGNLDVAITAKSIPRWLNLSPMVETKHTLRAGETLPFQMDIFTGDLEFGTSSILLTFTIQDDDYPDCFYSQDISLPLTVRVIPRDCVAVTGDRLRVPDADGTCICSDTAFEFGSACISHLVLIPVILVPLLIVLLVTVHLYVERKRELADSVWFIKTSDLIFKDPPEVLGRGTFGLVVLAEYRGTQVAVKRVIPPKGMAVAKPVAWPVVVPKASNKAQRRNSTQYFDFKNQVAQQEKESAETTQRPKSNETIYMTDLEHLPKARRRHSVQHSELKEVRTRPSTALEPNPIINRRGSGAYLPLSTPAAHRSSSAGSSDNYQRLKGDFVQEMRLLSKLRHPCITTVMGAVISKYEDPLLVMEYMDHGSLYDLLHNETLVLDGNVVHPVLCDISQGLRFLHAANPQVIHGDLKAHNILVDSKFRAKVADFGLSQKKQVGACGTPFWMAPELLRGESMNTAASDVYSFGIILYELYSRKIPFEDDELEDEEILKLVCDLYINKRPEIPTSMPEDVVALMINCTDAEAETRPKFREIDTRLKEFGVKNVEPGKVTYSLQAKKQMDGAANLLLEIFPKHIAEALSNGRRVEPEHFDCVTIFFSDIVGFTTISSELTPMKVSDLLDRLYNDFDDLSQHHCVFKVETIGDAWMGVTNLARKQPDHTKRIAEFAADTIKAASATLVDTDDPSRGYVQIRVGFHSGPVVANVVGSKAPRYTLIGDTVNISSRMESNSSANRILCSDRAANLLMKQCPAIPLKYRGKIEVKGKGEMATFWVNEAPSTRRQILSENGHTETKHSSTPGLGWKAELNDVKCLLETTPLMLNLNV